MKLKRIKKIPEIEKLYTFLGNSFEREMLTLALRNYCSMGNPIRFNNFAYVMRELLTVALNRLAPKENVIDAQWYERESDDFEVTRRQQLKFCAQGYFIDSLVPDYVEKEKSKLLGDFAKLYRKLNQYTHINEKYIKLSPQTSFAFLKDLISIFSSILEFSSLINEHIVQSVEESVRGIIFNHLFFESHEALIELSGQTIVEGVYIEDYSLFDITEDMLIFDGNGYVECELNYGSGNDGVSMGHSVPFLFSVESMMNDHKKLELCEEGGMILDNSGFYE